MRYCEAYCRLPIAALYRAFDRGRGTLVWRDTSGHVIGSARIMNRFDDVMRVAFDLSATGPVEAYAGELAVSLVWLDAGLHRREPYAACPGCHQPVKHLVARNYAWKCTDCHHLVNRSSLIRANARLIEKVEDLRAQIAMGRPRGMHSTTYERLRSQLRDSEERLGDSRIRADSRYTHVITHHVAGATESPRLSKAVKAISLEQELFRLRVVDYLNAYFVQRAYRVYSSLATSIQTPILDEIIAAIVEATRLRGLELGSPEELVTDRNAGGQTRTVVELPFLGHAELLKVHSDHGPKLPALFAQVDQEARVIRLTFSGSVEERPSLRAQIDEQLGILHEQIARQARGLAEYHNRLPSEARRYLRWEKSGRPAL